MHSVWSLRIAVFASGVLAGCGSNGTTLNPQLVGAAAGTPTSAPTSAPVGTAQPQVVHVGFTHTATTAPTFGAVAFYSPTSGAAAVITVKAGSQLVFTNDGGGGVPHTASGLGSSFPAAFDNSSGPTASGSTIAANTTWSTGNLNVGQTSAAFTVGPPGDYFFGCAYHYDSAGMRDVIVSQ